MSGAMRLKHLSRMRTDFRHQQDSGYFGAPFTASNNSLGAVGGGLQEEYGP